MRGLRLLTLAAALAAVAAWGAGPYLKGLTWRFEDRYLVVSFGVGEALAQPEMKENILSTRPVSLTFTIEILKHRTLWKSKVVARKVVVHTVRYDNLTRQFSLETSVDGQVSDQHAVDNWDDMASYMQSVKDLQVTSVANLEPSEGSYSIRARVHVLSGFVLWIIPWDEQTPWVSQPLSTP